MLTERPKLTFPQSVADYVTETYASANCILEYGTGGSTVLASELKNKKIYAVESDKVWAQNLKQYIDEAPTTKSIPEIIHVDIGPTKEWGHPTGDSHWREFYKYPSRVWDNMEQNEPDVVLIDGRFRLACFLITCLMTTRPVKVLFDDYADRQNYHRAENIATPSHYIDRMVVFDIQPGLIKKSDFSLLFNSMCSTA